MTKAIRKLLFVITALLCCYFTFERISRVNLDTSGTAYIVDSYAPAYYEMLSDNVGLTTINGISNVFINMKEEGYDIYKSDIKSNYIDVSFIKEDGISYRYYFEYPSGKITFFSSQYETSYTGISYIIDRRQKEGL